MDTYGLSNIITTLIISKLNISNLYYGVILTLVSSLLGYNYIYILDILGNNKILLVFLLIKMGILYLIYRLFGKRIKIYLSEKFVKKIGTKVILIDPYNLNSFRKYFSINLDIFTNLKDLQYGDLDVVRGKYMLGQPFSIHYSESDSYNIITPLNYPVKFYDHNFKLYGIIEWKKYLKKLDNTNKNNNNNNNNNNNSNNNNFVLEDWCYIYPEITILYNKDNIDVRKYLELTDKFYLNWSKRNIKLYFEKSLSEENKLINISIPYYTNDKEDLEIREKKNIYSYFHNKQSLDIWEMVKKVSYDSGFFEKFGQSPRANYILYGPPGSGKSSYIYRVAKTLYRHIISIDISSIKIKKNLYEKFYEPRINNEMVNPSEVIIVLEEFDIIIKNLVDLEKEMEDKDKIEKRTLALLSSEKKISDVNMSLVKVDESYTRLRDLLDILQGTVPVNGMIIFATTNKFDEIYKECPELFRPGRLTPVYFGYLGKEEFINMCKYYFNKYPSKELLDIYSSKIIKTSELIDIALRYNSYLSKCDAFKKFEKYINKI